MTTTANTHNQVVAQDVRNAGFKTTLGPASFNNMKQNQYEWRDVKGKPGRKAKAGILFKLLSRFLTQYRTGSHRQTRKTCKSCAAHRNCSEQRCSRCRCL